MTLHEHDKSESYYEQARHVMTERLHGLDRGTTMPALEIEHLYNQLGQAYELNAEWEKARVVYSFVDGYKR